MMHSHAVSAPTSRRVQERWKSVRKVISGHEVWLILLAMIAGATLLTPNFLTPFNIQSLLTQTAILGVLAIAQFLVILSGGYDLSVAAIMAFSSTVIAVYGGEGNFGLFTVVAILAGGLLGFINGLSITWGLVPPMIATLAMMGIARGLAFNTTAQAVSVDHPLVAVLSGGIGVFSYSTILWIVLATIVTLFLALTRTGTYIYAVGGDEDTARLAGIRVRRIKSLVYTLSGLISGIAGALLVVRAKSGVPHVGVGWELDTIAAVVIGGTKLNGGVGRLPSAMAGVLIYMLVRNALNIIGFDPFYQDIIKAAIILAAVGLSLLRDGKR
jgi:ribose/xylose/arabinose/galactoside ABC-type transport system permease subunit